MMDLHLCAIFISPFLALPENFTLEKQTDCLLYFFCSLRRTSTRASRRSFFSSSYSSACSFSLACCLFSISVRRFCAVEDELWDKVLSRAPNNLCPRLRSSICPLLRRSDGRSCVDESRATSWPLPVESWLIRGRLAASSGNGEGLRLVV